MIWRLQLLIDTDEAGIRHAAQAAKDMLRPVFGDVKSITIQDDLFRAVAAPRPAALLELRRDQPEHQQAAVNGHRRHTHGAQ